MPHLALPLHHSYRRLIADRKYDMIWIAANDWIWNDDAMTLWVKVLSNASVVPT